MRLIRNSGLTGWIVFGQDEPTMSGEWGNTPSPLPLGPPCQCQEGREGAEVCPGPVYVSSLTGCSNLGGGGNSHETG